MQTQVWTGGQGLTVAGTQVGHLAHLAGNIHTVAVLSQVFTWKDGHLEWDGAEGKCG